VCLFLAFFVIAVKARTSEYRLESLPLLSGLGANYAPRNYFVTKPREMTRSLVENVVVSSPPVDVQAHFMPIEFFDEFSGYWAYDQRRPCFWANDWLKPIALYSFPVWYIWKGKIFRQWCGPGPLSPIYVSLKSTRRSGTSILQVKGEPHALLSIVHLRLHFWNGVYDYKGSLYSNQSVSGEVIGIFRFISAPSCRICCVFRSGSGSLHLAPLSASVIGVFNQEEQRKSGQDESPPLKRREGKYLEFVAFLFFVVGFWFIYTALGVQRKAIISISKILIGVIILALGWATEQAALNLIDFGHIDWSHLL
jgi:hypothetical protein